jgi:hypothetical protein
MYWHCKQLATAESSDVFKHNGGRDGRLVTGHSYGPDIDLIHVGSGDESKKVAYARWRLVVEDYSRRFLTFQSDKLVALQGLAAIFASHYHDELLSGIWASDLPMSLTWATSLNQTTSRTNLADIPS